MPKMPDKFDLGQAPGGGRRALATVGDWPRDAGGLGAMASVAKGVAEVSGALVAKQEEADDYEVQKRIVDFDLEQEKRLDDAKRAAAPEAKGFTDTYRRGYDAAATDLMTRVPARLKPKVDEILVKRGASFEKRAYDFELAERDRWNIQDVNTQTSDLVTRTMGNPDTIEDNAQRGVALIRSSRLTQRAKIDAERKFLDTNAEFGIKALIDREIEAGRDAGDVIERLRRVPRGSMRAAISDAGAGTVGSVSEKYESGGRGVGFVSTGAGDPGGPSYGKHQLSSKDSMPAFLRSEEGAPYAERFKGLRPGSAAFNRVYSEIAREDPEGLARAQHGFYSRTHYQPLVDHAKGKGLAVDDRGVQEALFSISVQHGGAKKIVDAALANAGEAPADQIRALYAARSRYVSRLSDLPSDTKASVLNRYESEMKDALALVGQSSEAPGDGVARRNLPPVRGADASGRATLVKSGPAPADDGGPKDDLEEADQAEWGYMSPTTRRKLINYARTAGRAVVDKRVDDDIARIRLGKEPQVGPDGKSSLDLARAHMTHMQWERKRQAWEEARLEHNELSTLRSLTDSEAADHVASIVERAERAGMSVEAAAKVQKKADQRLAKTIQMRNTDPVRAVTGSIGDEPDDRTPPLANTAAAMRRIAEARQPDIVTGPDGVPVRLAVAREGMTPQQQWVTLFEARLADQSAVMPFEPEKHRILSKREAERLLMMPKDGKGLDYRAYRERLQEAAVRAEQKFGPKYAKRALEEAIGFHLGGGSADMKAQQSAIIRKMARGEAISSADVRALTAIERVEGVSLSSGIDTMARIDRAGRSQGMPAIAPMGDMGRPAIGQGMAQPSARQVEWLKSDPAARFKVFADTFGPDAAAAALLGQGGDAWGSARAQDKFPKSPKADEFQKAIPPTGRRSWLNPLGL